MKELWDIFTDYFGTTIFHPQYIMKKFTKEGIGDAKRYGRGGHLVDLGCGRMPYRGELEKVISSYTGVDHPKISSLYHPAFKPDVLADITKPPLPFPTNHFDIAILLEVLEYLEKPEVALKETSRILKRGGVLIVTTPFLYPLHDTPYDRNRFSETAIKELLGSVGFKVVKVKPQGNFFEFWALSFLVFVFKNLQKSGLLILAPLSLILATVINIITIVFSVLLGQLPANKDFPLNYLAVAKKP